MEDIKEKKKHPIRSFFIFLFVLGIGIFFYSRYIATTGLEVREYAVINNKLPENFKGLKIVQFSDLHYGTTIFYEELKEIVEKINLLNPDIVVFTGDLIDMDYKITDEETEKVIELFNQINSNIASYIVRGNHDYSKEFDKIAENINFKLLDNEYEYFYYKGITPIMIIGVEDYLIGNQDLEKAFTFEDNGEYKILLAHEPDTFSKLNITVDLMLSGHSHNGQIRLPFIGAIAKVSGARTYYDANYKVNGTDIFISGGLGTSKYPFRLFNRPSFNFYRFYNN